MIDSTSIKNKIILCIEAHSDTANLVEVMLEMEGCHTDLAATMQQGLGKAWWGDYDLILVNWFYEDGTGLELCQKIRQFDRRTPILFYSGVGHEPYIKLAMKAGAQAYLVKPVDLDELLQKIIRYTEVGIKE